MMTCAKSLADVSIKSLRPLKFVGDESNEQRVLDVVIERVAVADTINGKPGSRLNPLYRSRIR